jgi:hypothetical protein
LRYEGGEGGSKISGNRVTYYMDDPLLDTFLKNCKKAGHTRLTKLRKDATKIALVPEFIFSVFSIRYCPRFVRCPMSDVSLLLSMGLADLARLWLDR